MSRIGHRIDAPVASEALPATELSPRCVEAIAARVVELLHERALDLQYPASLVDVRELARRTRLSRTWIYEHASQLGAIRFGEGPKARLRFNPDTVKAVLERELPSRVRAVPPRRQRRITSMSEVELLPIAGNAPQLSRRAPPPGRARS
jgi:hypothetical protein